VKTALLCALVVVAVNVNADDWTALADKPPAGVSSARWSHLIGHWREKPYTVAEIQPCLARLNQAGSEGLPVEAILLRMEEGAVKKVDAALLIQSVQQRFDSLRTAKELLAGISPRGRPCPELMTSVSSALESGVPADGLRSAIRLGDQMRLCRLKTVVEAGESLKLMDLDDATVTGLMEDFVRNNLCCGETLRVVRLAGELHRDNVTGPQIRDSLAKTLAARQGGGGYGRGDCEGRGWRRGWR
jgi:hypothetical protein